MARDLGGERRDKAIYVALVPAGDALLRRDRPCDKRIRKRIRLTGEQGLLTVPGKTRAFSAAMRDSQRGIMTPVAGSLSHDSRKRIGGQARPQFACGCAPVKAMQESRPVAGGCRRAASACPAANGVAHR